MKIQESAENYLETILILSERSTYVRSIDIANELNFTKPSVSVAMKKLRENNLITVDGDGYIHLTEDGLAIANRMYERHKLLSIGSPISACRRTLQQRTPAALSTSSARRALKRSARMSAK